MKHFVSVILLGLLLAIRATAQSTVELDVTMDRDQFVPDEPLVIGVKISNHSGRVLRLGNRADWLSVTIESRDGRTSAQSSGVPEAGAVVLENGADGTKRINIAPLFRLSRPGDYRLSARIRIDEEGWKEDVATEQKPFHVFSATTIFEKEFGVPVDPAKPASGAPEIRKYMVQQARFLNNSMQLYLRLTDANGGQVYLVEPIAPTLNNNQPEVQIDKRCNLHVLNQIGRVSFGYSVFTPWGDQIGREVHEFADGKRPRLRFTQEGEVNIVGGARRPAPTDIPPYVPPVVEPIEVRKPGP